MDAGGGSGGSCGNEGNGGKGIVRVCGVNGFLRSNIDGRNIELGMLVSYELAFNFTLLWNLKLIF